MFPTGFGRLNLGTALQRRTSDVFRPQNCPRTSPLSHPVSKSSPCRRKAMHRYQNESGDLGQSIASEATRDRGQYSRIDAFSSSISVIAAIVRNADTKNRLEIEVPEKWSVSGRGGTKTTRSGGKSIG